jgi:hypothetical protein
VFGNDETFN